MSKALADEKKVIIPNPGFVIKTKIIQHRNSTWTFSKVFINICYHPDVIRPKQDFNPQTDFYLIVQNKWEIPIVLSEEKVDKDKKGNVCLVYDCSINTDCFRWCQIYKDLELILIEWCLEAIEFLYQTLLDRNFTRPKMEKKGTISKTLISLNNTIHYEDAQYQSKIKNEEKKSLFFEEDKVEQEDIVAKCLHKFNKSNSKQSKILIEEMKYEKPSASLKDLEPNSKVFVDFKSYQDKETFLITIKCKNLITSSEVKMYINKQSCTLNIFGDKKTFCLTSKSNNEMNSIEIPIKFKFDIKTEKIKCYFEKTSCCFYVFFNLIF